jgi:hypothetical protein
MTKDQYLKSKNDKESQINNLQQQLRELDETYIKEHSRFEVGEKVLLTEEETGLEKTHTLFIHAIHISRKGVVRYDYKKCKPDGTKSTHGFYPYKTIEVRKES